MQLNSENSDLRHAEQSLLCLSKANRLKSGNPYFRVNLCTRDSFKMHLTLCLQHKVLQSSVVTLKVSSYRINFTAWMSAGQNFSQRFSLYHIGSLKLKCQNLTVEVTWVSIFWISTKLKSKLHMQTGYRWSGSVYIVHKKYNTADANTVTRQPGCTPSPAVSHLPIIPVKILPKAVLTFPCAGVCRHVCL